MSENILDIIIDAVIIIIIITFFITPLLYIALADYIRYLKLRKTVDTIATSIDEICNTNKKLEIIPLQIDLYKYDINFDLENRKVKLERCPNYELTDGNPAIRNISKCSSYSASIKANCNIELEFLAKYHFSKIDTSVVLEKQSKAVVNSGSITIGSFYYVEPPDSNEIISITGDVPKDKVPPFLSFHIIIEKAKANKVKITVKPIQ